MRDHRVTSTLLPHREWHAPTALDTGARFVVTADRATRFWDGDPLAVIEARDELLEAVAAARPAWMRRAACAHHPELSWFTERGGDMTRQKAICAGCHVREPCLRYAMEHHCTGIWGGTSERQRKRMARRGGELQAADGAV